LLRAAGALECVHAYSLVHDDLPAMDDDDLRRGRPTNHKVYGEAIAVLAGDALLTKAFELIAKNAKIRGVRPQAVPAVVALIAEGAGTFGMIGGQVLDIQMEGGRWRQKRAVSASGGPGGVEAMLRSIHRLKTAALIRTSLQAGALLAGAAPQNISRFGEYGEKIGLAFQIADDVLDVVADKKKLGKSGSDARNKKLTFPALYGLDRSRQMALELVESAKAAIEPFGRSAQILKQLANFIVERDR
ncbi:MAG TPA: polyprenyl synthetase family protein, partial [Elusimicrobiota bacterium]|nr:polyprenyl synthetase family protein [Elusimicrobiota bacterium]